MSISFKKIREYLSCNECISLFFENGHYRNYSSVSCIPEGIYDDLYVYGIGLIYTEFTGNNNSETLQPANIIYKPAIEIALCEELGGIEENDGEDILFRDVHSVLEIVGNTSINILQDNTYEVYKTKAEIPDKYDDMYVLEIGIEKNDVFDSGLMKGGEHEKCFNKRIILSKKAKGND